MQQELPEEKREAILGKKYKPDEFRKALTSKPPDKFICTATPMVLNRRLSLQQGVFLCPGDVTCSWSDNLDALGWKPEPNISQAFVLDFSPKEAYDYFHRVNVTARNLFPGLDGYGKFMFGRANLLLGLDVEDDWSE